MKHYSVKPTESRQEMLHAIEASLLLGFQTVQAKFPVIIDAEGDVLPGNPDEIQKLWNLTGMNPPEEYVPASEHAGEVFDLEFRRKKGLEYLFFKGELLKDENQDLLPDHLNVKLVLPEQMDRGILLSACNLAFRLGM